jgi:hypothetical protein
MGAGAGVHGSAARGAGLSRLGGGSAGYRYGQSARSGSASSHSGSRYRQWGRYGVYGAITDGYGYSRNSDAYGDTDCSYVFRYSHGAYRRVAVCSEN